MCHPTTFFFETIDEPRVILRPTRGELTAGFGFRILYRGSSLKFTSFFSSNSRYINVASEGGRSGRFLRYICFENPHIRQCIAVFSYALVLKGLLLLPLIL